MVTILKNEDNLGSELGRALGSGLGAGLGALASRKVEKMRHKEESNRLQSLGFSPQLAHAFPKLPEKTQQEILSSVDWSRINNSHQQQPQQQPQIQQMQQPQQQQRMQQQQQMQPQGQPAPQQNVPRDLQQMSRPNTQEILRSLSGQGPQQPFAQQEQQFAAARQQSPQNQLTPNQQIGQAAAAQQVAEKEAQAQGLFKAPVDPLEQQKELADYKQQRKEQHELALYERKRMDEGEKESKEWLKETNKKSRAVKENNARLDRMENLARSGKLDKPGFSAALDTLTHGIFGFGINLKSLQSPESQEFDKLSKDMLSGIQDVFGSRILKTEVDNFLQTIPTLSQSNEGKIAVIENLKLLNEAKLAQDKTAKEIIKENGGKVPADLQLQVDDRLDDTLDKIHERFVNQIHTPIKNNTGTIGKAIKGLVKYAPGFQ